MTTLQCSYCSLDICDDNYLHCGKCGGDVHIKCLRHASTPGDLLGDVFFEFTCAKCMQLQYDLPSTSSESISGIREKFVRQRMPWLLVISLALYNLSIKSKGLSRHGYFHWRTHIVNFIDKNWDYLFDPSIKRRKKWTGSISGALSHNSPKYFTSGQELFEETGWWKLTHSNKTPKYIFKIYEQQCLKRQQIRNEKRQIEDSYTSDASNAEHDNKRSKQNDSEDELISTYSCSRMIPYMGRKPKIAKQLDVLEDDHLLNKFSQTKLDSLEDSTLPLNTVQSSLMDFLAESLASEDLSMFTTLPNMTAEPVAEPPDKNDILPSLDAPNDNANFYDHTVPFIKAEPMDLNGHLYNDPNSQLMITEKLKNFYSNPNMAAKSQPQIVQSSNNSFMDQRIGIGNNWPEDNQIIPQNNLPLPSENSSHEPDDENTSTSSLLKQSAFDDEDDSLQHHPETDEESDSEEFQPRIVQVTNFQQIPSDERANISRTSPLKKGKIIKQELISETDSTDIENKPEQNETGDEEEEETESSSNEGDGYDTQSLLKDCKPSLFSKQPRRQWPWLIERRIIDEEENELMTDSAETSNLGELSMMSEYEEKVLLQKLHRIISLEDKCNIRIPSSIRRFYRKLCVREWKRKHGKPLFNLHDYINARHVDTVENEKTKIIDRYQLITTASKDPKRSFYARIAGSFHCEFFESPYSQRVLHPYIFRNRQCFPPFLKLMCELQFKVNGTYPTRAPIDFCYVRPNHIAAVNSLLQSEFWPGIDMSECLSYPDYSVVALYKKLVVGCGFLVPDVGFNDAYISFMAVRPGWQRAGLGTFMLYHLIQTCMTKDITLHVSATNPAVVLYQKFGFKMEEVILNFYDKYLPFESKHSRHALFLRLMR